MSADPAFVWYFAYGSNLDPRTFLGRRQMRPRDTRIATLPGHRLVFDLPIGDGERGVANLLPDPAASVMGVAYSISHEQSLFLDRTEGVPSAYQRIEVALSADDGPLPAFTYLSSRRSPGRKPSPRYMGLLLRGARHHGLPEASIEALRDIELAIDEREQQLELIPRAKNSR